MNNKTILAIETVAAKGSVALQVAGEILTASLDVQRSQAQRLLPLLAQVLQQAECSPEQLDCLAVSVGPGSFTGIRIGVAIAQGLAYGWQKPVACLSTLQCLAQGVYRCHAAEHVLTAFDARMAEAYWGSYQLEPRSQVMLPLQADAVLDPKGVSNPSKKTVWAAAGSGWHAYRHLWQDKFLLQQLLIDFSPQAEDLLPAANLAAEKGQLVTALEVQPVYCRQQVAVKSQ